MLNTTLALTLVTLMGRIGFNEDPNVLYAVSNEGTRLCSLRARSDFVCLHDSVVLARCVPGVFGWNAVFLKHCDVSRGVRCLESRRDCFPNPMPDRPGTNPGVEFTCTSEGVFPDPYNCQNYYACAEMFGQLLSYPVRCGNDTAFDPATNQCSLRSTNPICRQRQFNCNTLGQMTAWPTNPNLFYVCMSANATLYPTIHRCRPNQIFSNGRCINSNNNNNNNQQQNFHCSSQGRFRDANNCRFYFECDNNLRAQRIMCPTGQFFHAQSRSCRFGNC